MTNKIELLSPAGNLSNLKTAIHFGADAVYGALKQFGLRAKANNFSLDELEDAIKLLHSNGKKFYLTLNSMPRDNDLPLLLELANKAYNIGIDAAIVSDIGVIDLLHKNIPELELHISTQANTLNSAACNFYHDAFNAKRIILARELTLNQISEIRKNIYPEIQLEGFVHGAMCMAYSGRCLLSYALTGRDGNQGACAQSCRWKYQLLEAKRPGEAIPIYEDELGTYLLSSFDLCMLDHIPDLINAGLDSLKIEGRMKSEYYVATTVSAYRRAIDSYYNSPEEYYKILPELMIELDKVGHRASNTGFYYGAPEALSGAEGVIQSMEYRGQILENSDANSNCRVLLKNKISVGDELELLSPYGVRKFKLDSMIVEKTQKSYDTYSVANDVIIIKIPFTVYEGDILRGEIKN